MVGDEMDKFISREILDELSYTSDLGQSLKQISLRNTPLDKIIRDIAKYRASYIDIVVQENLIGSRFKSDDSIYRKYEKTIRMNGGFKQCFNDVLGFRLRMQEYPSEYPEYFRMVNLRGGKQIDDGYRAVHLYYQRDNRAYPIEIQLWCGEDYQFNIWSHRWIYKYDKPDIGKAIYLKYRERKINSEQDFLEELGRMRGEEHA